MNTEWILEKNQKLIGGQKCYATFSDFSFWALPDQKMAGSKKKWVAKFFYYYCVSMRPKLKKVVYITMPKNLIFHFLSKTPILAKNGSPVPQGGQRKKSLACIKKLSNINSY